ncbi:hypothetical protein JZ751_027488 [Albula glossodonta]|uniref:Uncharacterized protein n=1 Tax=Albula glossodonta TaxID=121402 RepID=A0A8T2NN65_9TELE|nr:hypothetical protein JZ751_027488 [Albula glossodonta]
MALAVMSTLHLEKRVTSIMEVLAKAAVAEICKIIDEGTALLRVEMSGSKKENEALKKKLLQLESKLQAAQRAGKRRAEARENSVKIRSVGVQAGNEVRVAEGSNNEKEHSTLNIESVFGKEWSIRLWRDGGITAMKEEDCPLQPVSREEVPEPVENQLVLLPVKEEMFEEDLGSSESQRVLPVGKESKWRL